MSDTHIIFLFFFFNDTATTEIYTLSLHDALPIFARSPLPREALTIAMIPARIGSGRAGQDRKSTRLNSSHEWISYAVFCSQKTKSFSSRALHQEQSRDFDVLELTKITEVILARKATLRRPGEGFTLSSIIFFLMILRPPRSTLFPYTALFL